MPVQLNPGETLTDETQFVDPNAESTFSSEGSKGMIAGAHQLRGMGYGLSALTGDVTGNKDLSQWAREGLKDVEASTPVPAVGSYKDVNDISDAGKYLAYGLSTLFPMIAVSAATGGIGGFLGRKILMSAAEKATLAAVKAGASETIAKEIGNDVIKNALASAEKSLTRGAMTGMGAGSIGMEVGTIAGNQIQETGKTDPLMALISGIPAGLLDVIPEMALLKRTGILGGAKFAGKGLMDRLKNAGKGIAQQAMMEGSTEAMQSGFERWGAGKSLTGPDAINEYIDSAILAGIGGAGFGAVGNFAAKSSWKMDNGTKAIDLLVQGPEFNKYGPESLMAIRDNAIAIYTQLPSDVLRDNIIKVQDKIDAMGTTPETITKDTPVDLITGKNPAPADFALKTVENASKVNMLRPTENVAPTQTSSEIPASLTQDATANTPEQINSIPEKKIVVDQKLENVKVLFEKAKENGGSLHVGETNISYPEFEKLGNWMQDNSGGRVQNNRNLNNIVIDKELDWNKFKDTVYKYQAVEVQNGLQKEGQVKFATGISQTNTEVQNEIPKFTRQESTFVREHIGEIHSRSEAVFTEEGYTAEEINNAIAKHDATLESVTPDVGKKFSVVEVANISQRVVANLANPPKIITLETMNEMPKDVLAYVKGNDMGNVQGFVYKHDIYIIADTHNSSLEIIKTVVHELTHEGLGSFLYSQKGSQGMGSIRLKYDSLMDAIYGAHKEEITALGERYRNLDMETNEGRRKVCEEWLCNQSYEMQPKWYDKLVALFRDMLRLIAPDLKISSIEIRTVLTGAFDEFGKVRGHEGTLDFSVKQYRMNFGEESINEQLRVNEEEQQKLLDRADKITDPKELKKSMSQMDKLKRDHFNLERDKKHLTEPSLNVAEESPEEIAKRKEREDYRNQKFRPVEEPELVGIVKDLTEGKYPKIFKNMVGKLGGQLNGQFNDKDGGIKLWAGLTMTQRVKTLAHEIGHLVDWTEGQIIKVGGILAKIGSFVNGYQKDFLKEYPDSPYNVLSDGDRNRFRTESRDFAQKMGESETTYIKRIIPEYEDSYVTTEMILNILRGVVNLPKEVYEYLQKSDRKKEISFQAMRGVVDENMRDMKVRKQIGEHEVIEERTTRKNLTPEEFNKAVNKRYAELLKEEIAKRKLYSREQIKEELIKLSAEWRPWSRDDSTAGLIKYRDSANELYADAMSVLLNEPEKLKADAPTFYNAFFDWLENKPQFKSKFDELQTMLKDPQRILENRDKLLEEGSKKGAELRAKEAADKIMNDRITATGLWTSIRKYVDTSNIGYIQKVQKWVAEGKPIADIQHIDWWMEQLPYINSEIGAYHIIVDKILKSAEKDGITIADLDKFMKLERIVYEEKRNEMANPQGFNYDISVKQLEYIKVEIIARAGIEQYNKLVKYADDFRMAYRKNVVDVVAKAGFLSDNMIKYMLNNPYYVTFSNIEHEIQRSIGKGYNAEVGLVFEQYGGHGEVDNVVVATVMKGSALIRAARHHETKMAIVQTLIEMDDGKGIPEVKIATRTKGGLGWQNPPKGYGLIVTMFHGKMEGFFIEKELADMWNTQREKADSLMRLGMASKALISKLFIQWNPGWIIANPVRDLIGTIKKNKASFPDVLKAYKNTFIEALQAGWDRNPEREIRLQQERVLPHDRFFNEGEPIFSKQEDMLFNKESQTDQKGFYTSMKQAYTWLHSNGYDELLILPPIGRFLSRLGKAGERWGKFAGDELYQIQKKEGIPIGEMERRHNLITKFGTPNSFAEGMATRYLEILFPFSRIAIQDMVSGVEAFKEHKAGYLLKTIVINILPKVFIAAAVSGMLGDEEKERAEKITTYFRRMYTVIPIGDMQGQTVFLKIPQDYTGQSIGAIVDSMLSGQWTGTTGALGTVAGYQPFNTNPFFNSAMDWIKYYTSKEIPTNFYGNKIIPDLAAQAGGLDAAQYLAKSTWNDFFGGLIYKFKADNVERLEPEMKKLLGTVPFNAIGRFIGVTDAGIEEESRLTMEKTISREAKRTLDIRNDIVKRINKAEENITYADLAEYWSEAVQDGRIDPGKQPVKEFVKSYMEMAARKTGSPYLTSFENARTSSEKSDLLNKWARSLSEEKYTKIISELAENRLLTKGTFKQMGRDEVRHDNESSNSLMRSVINDILDINHKHGSDDNE